MNLRHNPRTKRECPTGRVHGSSPSTRSPTRPNSLSSSKARPKQPNEPSSPFSSTTSPSKRLPGPSVTPNTKTSPLGGPGAGGDVPSGRAGVLQHSGGTALQDHVAYQVGERE